MTPNYVLAAILSGALMAPAVFSATQLAKSNRIYQRDTVTGGGQGLGAGTVPCAITVTTAGTVYARRRALDGTTILQNWWLVGSVSTGSQTLNVTGVDVPALSDPDTATQANDGYFFLDLSGDKTTVFSGTTPISMGDVIAAGTSQSLVYRLFTMVTDTTTTAATTGYAVGTGTSQKGLLTISPFCRVFVNQGNNGAFDFTGPSAMAWQLPISGTATAGSTTAAYNSAGVVALSRMLIKQRRCPVGFIGATCGQTDIAFWSGSNGGVTALNAVLTACDNKWSGEYITGIGHTDSFESTAGSTFGTNWAAAVNDAQARNTLTGRTPCVYAFTIPFVNGKYGNSFQTDNAIRQAGLSTATAQGYKHMTMPDLATSDGVHPNQAGAVRMALHIFRASRPVWNVSYGDHKGPTISSVTRGATPGATMTINLALNGATSLALGPGSGTLAQFGNFRMALAGSGTWNNAGTATAYALGASDLYTAQTPGVPGTTITLTDPSPDTAIDLWLGSNFTSTITDGSSPYLYDNRIETDEAAMGIDIGRPLEPNLTAFTIAAGANVTYNLTPTGTPTYPASAAGFGNAMDSARATVAFGLTPARTLLVRFNAGSALPSAIEGLAQACNDWIGLNTDGTLRVAVGNTVIAAPGGAALNDSTWHEVELDIQAGTAANANGSYFVYLDGTRLTSGTIANKSANSGSIYVRAINGANLAAGGRQVDSVAVFSGVRNIGTTKTVLSSPLVGNEANLRALFNFESNLADSCTN